MVDVKQTYNMLQGSHLKSLGLWNFARCVYKVAWLAKDAPQSLQSNLPSGFKFFTFFIFMVLLGFFIFWLAVIKCKHAYLYFFNQFSNNGTKQKINKFPSQSNLTHCAVNIKFDRLLSFLDIYAKSSPVPNFFYTNRQLNTGRMFLSLTINRMIVTYRLRAKKHGHHKIKTNRNVT